MIDTLVIVQIILAVILTLVVLMQKSSSIGLGAYSGSNDSLFGAKGPVSFLSKATFIIGAVFIINTLALVYLYNKDNSKSVLDNVDIEKIEKSIIPTAPVTTTPESNENSVPTAPVTTPPTQVGPLATTPTDTKEVSKTTTPISTTKVAPVEEENLSE